MLQKVCLIVNYNLYESKRHFTKKLAEALNRKQIATKIIDAQEGSLNAAMITEIHQFAPDITCSFNTLLPTQDQKFLWDYLKIPHVSFVVDPILYSLDLVKSPYSIVASVDALDCEQLRQYQFQNVFFCPHGIERELAPAPNQKKIYDVVFLGSCYDFESLHSSLQKQYSKEICEALDKAANIVLSDNKTPLTEALVRAWNEAGLSSEGLDFISLYNFLDTYTRGKDRVDLIRSIKDAQVHVFGELAPDNPVGVLGWQQYFGKQSNVTVHPAVPFGQALDILKQSKICLNSMPFFKNGSHERIFASLMAEALPFTMDNLFVREHFEDGKDLMLYQHSNLGVVNGKINDILAHEDKRQAMVAKGKAKVLKEQTWDARVDTLLKELPPILKRIRNA